MQLFLCNYHLLYIMDIYYDIHWFFIIDVYLEADIFSSNGRCSSIILTAFWWHFSYSILNLLSSSEVQATAKNAVGESPTFRSSRALTINRMEIIRNRSEIIYIFFHTTFILKIFNLPIGDESEVWAKKLAAMTQQYTK